MNSTVAIVNWNSGLLLRACIESLLAAPSGAEILVIDNASEDTSVESVQGFRNRVNFAQNSVNRGFAAAVNQAFHLTSTPYVLILNPDVRVLPGAVQHLEHFLDSHERTGAAGGYVGDDYPPRKFPTVGRLVGQNLGMRKLQERRSSVAKDAKDIAHGCPPVAVEQPAAAALMVRRDAYDEVGGFDEEFYPAWYEDVDFCQRLRAKGWDIYYVPEAQFLHEGGYSADVLGSAEFARSYYSNQVRYARKHFGAFGTAAVRASIAAGMLGRMIGRPKDAAAYGKVLIGAIKGW